MIIFNYLFYVNVIEIVHNKKNCEKDLDFGIKTKSRCACTAKEAEV